MLLLFVFVSSELSAERKKVGLVLSGGGAKGMAHIGVIKVLEEVGIPIDYIVGTSMGSIVGGLYSIGYDANTLDSLVRAQDWAYLLSDKIYRDALSFSQKESSEIFLLSIPVSIRDKRRNSGFFAGQNIYNLFTDLAYGYHDSLNFNELPIPFACVAANIVDGSEVAMHHGNLVESMRASMAIPGVFAPVRMGDRVLVDGGIANNFPADIAKAMGADIVIGIDVQADLKVADELNSMTGIMGQLINLLCLNKHEENRALTDIYIHPEVNDFSAGSFTKPAIDTLLQRGEVAGRLHLDELRDLKNRLGIDANEPSGLNRKRIQPDVFDIRSIIIKGVSGDEEKWIRRSLRIQENGPVTLADIEKMISGLYGTRTFSEVSYRLLNAPHNDLELTLTKNHTSMVNLGFRFDTEDMAAILLNMKLNNNVIKGSRFSITARLSKNPLIRVDYSLEHHNWSKLNLAYMFKYNDFNVYTKGHRTSGVTYRYHLGELGISDISLKNFNIQMGLRFEHYDYDSFLYSDERLTMDVNSESFISYYVLARLETYDRRYYPTRGLSLKAAYNLYTDNFATYNGNSPFSALSADFTGVISLTRRMKVLPSVYGRVLIGHHIAYPYLNYMGGTEAGRYMAHQLPFHGIKFVELFKHSVLAAKVQIRQRMGEKHYVSFVGNYALQSESFWDIFQSKGIFGGSVGYSYDFPIGPVEIVFNMSDWSKKFGFYFNLGYYF